MPETTINTDDGWEAFRMRETIPLPYVIGELNPDPCDDDSVDVYVEQCARGHPYANLVLVPGGPTIFTLCGFGTDELRMLAKFLIDAANGLDQHVNRE